MNNFRFKLNRKGVRELMKSTDMKNVLYSRASKAHIELGKNFYVYVAGTRVILSSANRQGYKEAMKDNRMLKAVGRSKQKGNKPKRRKAR
jgi:hypothetical protein|nr:MAG TPA: type I neck protein [Caudoviricetes sp.]